MPTYEYVCRDCAEHLEVVQSFRDDSLVTCGKCGGNLRKVFSPAGIIFKGSGFYSTDSRAGQSAGSAASSTDGSSGDSDSGSSSGDTSQSDSSSSSDSDTSGSRAESA